MANNNQHEKKENPLLSGILMLVCGVVLLIMGGDYNWVLFGILEIPLQIPAAIIGVIGLVQVVSAIRAKNMQMKEQTEE